MEIEADKAKTDVKISRKNWTVIWLMGMFGQLCWALRISLFQILHMQ